MMENTTLLRKDALQPTRRICHPEFEPLEREDIEQTLSRPSLSYWKDSFRRLKMNRLALASVVVILVLSFFVSFGPSLYRIEPHSQNMNVTSISPSLNVTAIVLNELEAFEPRIDTTTPSARLETLLAPLDLQVLGQATTKNVRISWKSVHGASGYAIYRNEVYPSPNSLGIPIGEITQGAQHSFEDTSGLDAKTYYYSIVPKNENGEESSLYSTFPVTVQRTLNLEEALIYDPNIKLGETVRLPSAPFGTDSLGRDLLARLMAGGRVSLFIGIFSSLAFVLLGTIIGAFSGYLGGSWDRRTMALCDFISGLPFLLFMILLKVVLSVGAGESGIAAMMIALVALSWTGTARLVRGQVLQLREAEYVQAAKLLGASKVYIMGRHLIPNFFGIVLVALSFGIPSAIFTEAFLSFIGLGVASPTTSWGSMCTDGIQSLLTHPHEFFFPAVFISLTVLAFNILGDGLRDALDPQMRGR